MLVWTTMEEYINIVFVKCDSLVGEIGELNREKHKLTE